MNDEKLKTIWWWLVAFLSFFGLLALVPMMQGPIMPKPTNSSDKVIRDNESKKSTVKLPSKDCPKGSSKIPDKEIKKFVSGNSSAFTKTGYGEWKLDILVETNWNIASAQILFGFEYNNGIKREVILDSDNIFGSPGLITFYFGTGNQTKDLDGIKNYYFRVISACGTLRPMKIEIKISEAFKKIENKSSEALKEFTDLFSR